MEKIKVLFRRFLRGFVSGFVGSAIAIGVFTGQTIGQLGEWLTVLGIAGFAGGLMGGFLALDKALRWKKE